MDELYVTLARQHFTSGTMTLDQAGKDTQEGEFRLDWVLDVPREMLTVGQTWNKCSSP